VSAPPAPRAVVAAAAVVPALPSALLAWQVAWMVTPAVAPYVNERALAVGAALAAAVGGRAGAVGPVDGVGGRLTARAVRLAVIMAVAVGVRLVSPDLSTAAAAIADDPGSLVTGAAVGIAVALGVLMAIARPMGRLIRRQADARLDPAQQRDAEINLLGVLLTAGVVSAGLTAVPWLGGTPPSSVQAALAWVPVGVLAVALTGLALARRAVLASRSAADQRGPGRGPWWRTVAGATVLVALTVAVGAPLLAPAEPGVGGVLPSVTDLPRGPLTAPPADLGTPAISDVGERVAWGWLGLLACTVVVVALYTAGRGRRRWRGWWSLRALLDLLRWSHDDRRDVADTDEPVGGAEPLEEAAAPPPPWRRLVGRLRRRPRDPAQAILHDYRSAQRHLAADRRRRHAETASHHARRVDEAALRELAALVVTARYTTHRPTADDAARSRVLARRLRARR
jgi:hypothetical protein